jgi:hypothetical protein
MGKNKGNKKELFQVELNKFQIMRVLAIIWEQDGPGCWWLKVEGKTYEEHDNELLGVFSRALGKD